MNFEFINNEMRFCNLANQDREQNQRFKYAISRIMREKEESIHQEESHHKICPHCHILMNLLNECDFCGYKI